MLPQKHCFFLIKFFLLFFCLVLACAPTPEKTKKECTSNGECKSLADYCSKAGKCTPISCSQKDDCRGGWYCNTKTSKCQNTAPVECRQNDDCTNSKECQAGKCVEKQEGCKSNDDCKDSAKPECKDGKCIEKKEECKGNEDCKDSSKPECKDGKCIEKKEECKGNEDCKDPKKPRCTNGKCVEDTRPGEGAACKLGETVCKLGLTCDRPDPAKAEGVCREGCEVFSPKCKKPRVCMQKDGKKGICVDPNNGKKLGEACEKAKTPCEKNLHCVEWKKKFTCHKPCDDASPTCESDEECYEVSKNKFVCVPERAPCGPGRPCKEDKYQCVNNRCSPPPSCDQIKCKPDELCENSACRKKKCPKEKQCQAPNKCDAKTGICAPPGGQDPPCKACSSGGTCPTSNEICLGGGSLSNNPSERFCIARCPAGTCTDSKHFACIKVNLTGTACTSASQCKAPFNQCLSGKCTASTPLCMPKIGTCKNRCKTVTNCSPPKKCIPATGACITPGKALCASCQHADECGGKDDLCLRYPSGSSHCGKDCRSGTCPSGYRCFPLTGSALKQCAPASLKCGP